VATLPPPSSSVEQAAADGDELAQQVRTGTPDSLLRDLALHFTLAGRQAQQRREPGTARDRPTFRAYVKDAAQDWKARNRL
jgi:hypothetical protein